MNIKKNDSLKKSHIFPEDPHEPISTKFGIAGRLANDNPLRVFDSVRGRILSFSYLQAIAQSVIT